MLKDHKFTIHALVMFKIEHLTSQATLAQFPVGEMAGEKTEKEILLCISNTEKKAERSEFTDVSLDVKLKN
jgi:hypothetical protein